MEVSIVNPNYFYETHWYKKGRILISIFLTLFAIESLLDYLNIEVKLFKHFSNVSIIFFVIIGIILFLKNSLFTRIGTFSFSENQLIIIRNNTQKTIDLKTITEITFRKQNTNFYTIKIFDDEFCIELNYNQFCRFKDYLKENEIAIKYHHFTDRIPRLF